MQFVVHGWSFKSFSLIKLWVQNWVSTRNVGCHRRLTLFFLSVSKLSTSLVVIFWMLKIAQTALTLRKVWWQLNLFLLKVFVGVWGMVLAFVLFMIFGFQTGPLGKLYTSLICWSLIIVSMIDWLLCPWLRLDPHLPIIPLRGCSGHPPDSVRPDFLP